MKIQSLVRSAAFVAALVASTMPAFSKPLAKTINISQNAKVGKADLKAGEYRLLIDGNKATVNQEQDHRGGIRRPLGRSRRQIKL